MSSSWSCVHESVDMDRLYNNDIYPMQSICINDNNNAIEIALLLTCVMYARFSIVSYSFNLLIEQ